MLNVCVCVCYILGATTGRDTAEVGAGLTCTCSRGRESWIDGETRGGGGEDQRTSTPDSETTHNRYTSILHPTKNPLLYLYLFI